VNRRFARLIGVPFVKCLIHAFNLAIRALTTTNSNVYDESLSKVIEEATRLARHFKNLKNGSCLRQLTPLVPKLACPTRWSGNLDAVVRYDRLRKYYKDAMNNGDCSFIDMYEGKEWDYIVSSKKKLLKSIGNNMMAIQTSKLKLAAVFRSFETTISRKQQWKNVRLDNSYLDLIKTELSFGASLKSKTGPFRICYVKSDMLWQC